MATALPKIGSRREPKRNFWRSQGKDGHIMLEVAPKLGSKWFKVVPSWRQDGPPKWLTWCPFGGYLAQDWLQTRIEAKFLAKLRPRWAHHGRSWGQVVSKKVQVRAKLAPRWANFAPKMAELRLFWEAPWSYFLILGKIFAEMADLKKRPTLHHFWCFFKRRDLLGMVLGAVLGVL